MSARGSKVSGDWWAQSGDIGSGRLICWLANCTIPCSCEEGTDPAGDPLDSLELPSDRLISLFGWLS